MAATLKDVAKLAEVDISAVSRTLSNHPRAQSLRPETRERIFAAARKLGYRKNIFASAMRSGINRTVAVINTESEEIRSTPSALRVLAGIIEGASEANYGLKTYTDGNLPAVMDDILSNQISKVICMSPDHGRREECATLCRQHKLSLVFVYETAHGEFPSVATDNFGISKEVVEYIASSGHRRIALLCGDYRHWHYMTEKYDGYLAGLRAARLEPEFSMMICDNTPQLLIEKLLDRPAETRPTAFFCIGDGFAMLVQRLAIRRNLRIPEDISMTGFGCTTSAEDGIVPLSSIDEKQKILGMTAMRLILKEKINFPCDPDGTYRVPADFIKRESVVNRNE